MPSDAKGHVMSFFQACWYAGMLDLQKNHLAFVYASSTNRTLIQLEDRVGSVLLAPSGMLSFTAGRTAPHGGEGGRPCTQR